MKTLNKNDIEWNRVGNYYYNNNINFSEGFACRELENKILKRYLHSDIIWRVSQWEFVSVRVDIKYDLAEIIFENLQQNRRVI